MKSNFFDDVVDLVKLIPQGRVTTYGAIAKYLGASKSSRTVTGIAANQLSIIYQHRVVNRLGVLSGKTISSFIHAQNWKKKV